MPTNDDTPRQKIIDLIRDGRICSFTTSTPDGHLVSRPMGLQQAEFDGDLWFFTDENTPKIQELADHPEVNLSFNTKGDAWVSISGKAQLIHDGAKARELWNPFLKAWFPDGLDTPGLALIKVHAATAEYWDSEHGKLVSLIEVAVAAATGKPAPEGENEVVELDR